MNSGLKGFLIGIGSLLLVVLLGLTIYWGATPKGKKQWNNYWNDVQQADDDSNYETRKQVEDTCRSMISSYNADKLIYQQYKDSEDKVLQSSAQQAKIRANQTASTYNNYIIKNSYVWKNNVPSDIYMTLTYIE